VEEQPVSQDQTTVSPAWLAALDDALDRRGEAPATPAEIASAVAEGITPVQAADEIAACREADNAAA
jgi:hypothetical protein